MGVYFLAEMLHTPVFRLKSEMPFSEYIGWAHYFKMKASQRKGKSGNLLAMDTDEMLKGLGI
jgi:hypothetical protein